MPQIIFDFTAQQGQRVSDALGKIFSLRDLNGAPRPATLSEAKQYLISHLKYIVMEQEKKDQINHISIPDVEIT